MRLFIACLLVAAATADDFFQCPSPVALNGVVGNSRCSDNNPGYDGCGQLIQPNSTCTIIINAPDSSNNGAQLNLVASGMSQQDDIRVTYLFGNLEHNAQDTTWNLRAGLPFPGTAQTPILQIIVTASANSTMQLGYFVTRFVPSFKNGTQYSAPVGQPAQFVQLKDSNVGDYWEVTTTNQLALSSGVSPTTNQHDLLNFWLYEGIGADRRLIGNAYSSQFFYTHTATSRATVMNVLAPSANMTATLIFNDYQNIQNCRPYLVEWVQNGNYLMSMTDNSTDSACITILNDVNDPSSFFFTQLTAGSDPLTPYSGTVRLSTGAPVQNPIAAGIFLAQYGSNTSTALPQQLAGFARTFYFSRNDFSLSFARDAQSAQDHVPFTSRSGFIMSNYYTFNMSNQNSFFYMNSSSPFTFNMTITNSLSQSAVINVYGAAGLVQKIAVASDQGSVYSFTDTMIDLDINGGLGSSSGVLLNYVVGAVAKPVLSCPAGSQLLVGTIKQDLAVVPNNYECSYNFTFDPTAAVEVSVQAYNLSAGEVVEVIGLYDKVTSSGASFNLHAAFPGGQVVIHVKSLNNTALSLKYSVSKRNIMLQNPTLVDLTTLNDAYYLHMDQVTQSKTSWQISANGTQVAVVSASPPNTPPYDFLNFFVYEGAGDSKTLVGSLYGSYGGPWKSNGSIVTVYYAMIADQPNVGTLLFNLLSNLLVCTNYKAQWAYGNPITNFTIAGFRVIPIDTTLDATNGTACVTIIDDHTMFKDDLIIYDYVIDLGSNPFVMAGAPVNPASTGDSRYLGSMSEGQKDYFDLPQTFLGFSRTIYLSSGVARLSTTTDTNVGKPSKVYAGRQGFIMSKNYPYNDYNQDAHFVLQTAGFFTVSFKIQYSDAPADAYLLVYTDTGLSLNISMSDPISTTRTFKASGSLVSFSLDGGSNLELNHGSYITYVISSFTPPTTTMGPSTTTVTPGSTTGQQTTTAAAPGVSTTAPQSNGNVTVTQTTAPPVPTTPKAAATVAGLLVAVINLLLFL